MDHEDSELFLGKGESLTVRGNQVEEENDANQIPTGENGDSPIGCGGFEVDQEALKIAFLCSVEPLVYLG